MNNEKNNNDTIINGYIDELIENMKDKTSNKISMGYELNKDGSLKLTNEKVFNHLFPPELIDDAVTSLYETFKSGSDYIKAAKKFDKVYSNIILHQKAQIEASLKQRRESPGILYTECDGVIYENPNNYDINLVLLDTSLLYMKLKENKIISENTKKYKLFSDKVKEKTKFMQMVSIIELALKKYKEFDKTTQRQIIALVAQTVQEAENFL